MWMPCNFLETIRLREHMGYQLKEHRLVGLHTAPGQKFAYVFEEVCNYPRGKYVQPRLHHMDLENNIAFWANAFSNEDSYDAHSLNAGEIDLKLTVGNHYTYNRYFFDTKSSASGRLISLHYDRDNGMWGYTFSGSDGLHKSFNVKELLVNKHFIAYADDPLFD